MSINGQRTSPPRAYHIFQVFVMLAPQLISAYKAAFFPHACNSQPRSSNCFYILSGLKVRCMMHGNTIGALQSSLAAFIKRVTIVSSSSCKILFQSLLSIVHPHVFHLLCVSTSLFHFPFYFFFLLHNPILFSFLLSLLSFSMYMFFCCRLCLSQYWTSHAVYFSRTMQPVVDILFRFSYQVRSPHDDVNSVTSGETTTSDSGRGGSEDDTALPPIAEVPPESGSKYTFFIIIKCIFVHEWHMFFRYLRTSEVFSFSFSLFHLILLSLPLVPLFSLVHSIIVTCREITSCFT